MMLSRKLTIILTWKYYNKYSGSQQQVVLEYMAIYVQNIFFPSLSFESVLRIRRLLKGGAVSVSGSKQTPTFEPTETVGGLFHRESFTCAIITVAQHLMKAC